MNATRTVTPSALPLPLVRRTGTDALTEEEHVVTVTLDKATKEYPNGFKAVERLDLDIEDGEAVSTENAHFFDPDSGTAINA